MILLYINTNFEFFFLLGFSYIFSDFGRFWYFELVLISFIFKVFGVFFYVKCIFWEKCVLISRGVF